MRSEHIEWNEIEKFAKRDMYNDFKGRDVKTAFFGERNTNIPINPVKIADPLLVVENISKIFHSEEGMTKALSDINFSVKKGEFVSIVGPSGCGKSTLLSIIAGLIEPSMGQVKYLGVARDSIGYMLQKDHLFEWRSIRKNASLGLEVKKQLTNENKLYTEELLNKYGLGDFLDHYPSDLSGGMRQRVALIRTLATKPELLLLDEPFSALDYQTRLYIADEVGDILKAEEKTAILITHDIAEAVSLSDRVIVLSKRPGSIRAIHPITFEKEYCSALEAREAKEFRAYFNIIWKELDVHVS